MIIKTSCQLPTAKPKCFVFTLPKTIDEMLVARIFNEASLSLDTFAHQLLGVICKADHWEYHHSVKELTDTIFYMSKLLALEFDVTEAIHEVIELCQYLRKYLIEFGFYQQGYIVFNALWLEAPDTITFFRMDKNDVA